MEDRNLDRYIEIVESAIAELIGDPVPARGEKKGQWNLVIGNYSVMVDVYNLSGKYFLQIVCPILKLEEVSSDKVCQVYRKALEINDRLIQASFSIYNEGIWLRNIRNLEGISVEEARYSINILGQFALKYGEELRQFALGHSSED